ELRAGCAREGAGHTITPGLSWGRRRRSPAREVGSMADSAVNGARAEELAAPADDATERSSALLGRVASRSRERFTLRRQILSFSEYFAEVLKDPRRHTRDAAHYLRD